MQSSAFASMLDSVHSIVYAAHMFKRMFILWLIGLPLFYVFGLPYLVRFTETKLRAQGHASCTKQLYEQGLVPAQITAERGDGYCACLNEALHLQQADLFEIAKTRNLPPALQQALEARVETCSPMLHGGEAPPKTNADGSEELYL